MAERKHALAGIALRGVLIGLADLIPGVSGGTIAFISGIYERLIAALSLGASVHPWLMLLRGHLRAFWAAIDGTFLAALAAGVLAAVLLGAEGLRWLLLNQTAALLAFFCGLTLAAACAVAARLRERTAAAAAAFACGAAAAALIVAFDPVALQAAPPPSGFFLAGMLAFSAMILPGISGSFLLLLIGVYPFLLEAVHSRNLGDLAAFAAGGACGLLALVKLLRLLLMRHHDTTVAVLCGIMIGALPKLWPWKEGAEGIKAILQPAAAPWSMADPQYAAVAASFVGGIALIAALEAWARRMQAA